MPDGQDLLGEEGKQQKQGGSPGKQKTVKDHQQPMKQPTKKKTIKEQKVVGLFDEKAEAAGQWDEKSPDKKKIELSVVPEEPGMADPNLF